MPTNTRNACNAKCLNHNAWTHNCPSHSHPQFHSPATSRFTTVMLYFLWHALHQHLNDFTACSKRHTQLFFSAWNKSPLVTKFVLACPHISFWHAPTFLFGMPPHFVVVGMHAPKCSQMSFGMLHVTIAFFSGHSSHTAKHIFPTVRP